jgi:hypothetical protein
MSTSFVIWLGAILTLGAFSYLFKENEFYKGIEHLYVGCAAGYTVAMGYFNIVTKAWQPVVSKGQWWVIIPAALGVMLFGGYVGGSEWRFLRRYPIAFITGTGAGLTIRTAVEQQFVAQIRSTVLSLNTIDNFIIVFGVMAVVAYFFFTFKQNTALGIGAGAGKWVIMITFGAAFGNAIQGRISLLIGRISFIFGEWIHLIK